MISFLTRPASKYENAFRQFAVATPAGLMTVLHNRIFEVVLNRYWGACQVHDLTIDELNDLDALVLRYEPNSDACHIILDGRELSLLIRFLTQERLHMNQLRRPVTNLMSNAEYWELVTDLLLATKQPTRLVKLSFLG